MKTPLLTIVVLVLAGCGTSDRPGTAAERAAKAQAQDQEQAPVVAEEAVAAVLQSAGKPVAALHFVLEARPVLGAVATLRLNISGVDPVPTLLLTAQGEGFTVDAASAAASLALAEGGAGTSHQLKFTSQKAGLGQIVVRLRDADSGNAETVYAIPVLVAAAAATG